jgi:hypothetical protein
MKKALIQSTVAVLLSLSLFLSCSAAGDDSESLSKPGEWFEIDLDAHYANPETDTYSNYYCDHDYEITKPGYYCVELMQYPYDKQDVDWDIDPESYSNNSCSGRGDRLSGVKFLNSGKYTVTVANRDELRRLYTEARLVLVTESGIILPNEGFTSPVTLTLDVAHEGKCGYNNQDGLFGYSYYSFVAPENGDYSLEITSGDGPSAYIYVSYGTKADYSDHGDPWSEDFAFARTGDVPLTGLTTGTTYYLRIDAMMDTSRYNEYTLKMIKDVY